MPAKEQTRFQREVEANGIHEALDAVLEDPSVRFFAKDTIRAGLGMDPLDAYLDACLAADVLRAWMDEVLKTGV